METYISMMIKESEKETTKAMNTLFVVFLIVFVMISAQLLIELNTIDSNVQTIMSNQ